MHANMDRRTFIATSTRLFAAASLAGGALVKRAVAADAPAAKPPKKEEWVALFNGKDLKGWKPEGKATWKVEEGCLVGVQGPGNAAGDLFTEQEFADFELVCTYKIQWPANSGIWFRYQSPKEAYQADILEYKNPECYSGTLYCPAKVFLSMNTDPKLVKREDWNTMKILAQGDHLVITLNDKVCGDVHDALYAKGRVGFQIHPGDEFKDMKITVREIKIRKL